MNTKNESHPLPNTTGPTPVDSWKMFDRIAGRYDFLNRLLSFRRDVGWRAFLCQHLPEQDDLRVLDLATGTADVLLAVDAQSGRVRTGVGLDRSAGMIQRAKQKIERTPHLAVLRGDAMHIAARDDSFDVVTIAFGIRNIPDVDRALKEMYRVLVPGGRVLILEFSLPENKPFRALYLWYFRNVLPVLGGWVSGNSTAYRYLNQSVEQFPYGEAFQELMHHAGFAEVRFFPLSLGIATLYRGEKKI